MRITKKKIVAVAATTAVIALGGTAAFAYFTTGGTGTGTGTVGSAVAVSGTVFVEGTLNPDSAPHRLSYTVNNTANFPQSAHLASVAVTGINGSSTLIALCDIQVNQPTIPGGATVPANAVAFPIAAGPGTGSIYMVNTSSDQTACAGATINLTVTLS